MRFPIVARKTRRDRLRYRYSERRLRENLFELVIALTARVDCYDRNRQVLSKNRSQLACNVGRVPCVTNVIGRRHELVFAFHRNKLRANPKLVITLVATLAQDQKE